MIPNKLNTMYRFILLFMQIFITSSVINAQDLFENIYGTCNYENGEDLVILSDKSKYILANHYETSSLYKKILLIKLDSLNNYVWSKYYSSGDVNEPSTIEKFKNKLLIGGTANHKAFMMQIDTSGNIIWSYTYSRNDNMFYGRVYDMSVVSDNEIAIVGRENGNDYYDVLSAAKLDSSGNVIWSKGFYQSEGRYSLGRNIIHTNDNKLLIGGYLGLYNSTIFVRPVLIKLDLSGGIQWMNYYLLNDNKFGYESPPFNKTACIQFSADSSYIFAGNYDDPIENRWNPFLLKINPETGHTIWGRNYEVSYNTIINYLFELNNKLYLIGNTSSDMNFDSRPFLLISDSSGMPLIQGTYGKFNNCIESSNLLDDRIYLVGSSKNYYGAPYSLTNLDVYFTNMNQDGKTISLVDSLYDTKRFDFDTVSANSDIYSMELNLIKEPIYFQRENINTILGPIPVLPWQYSITG